jgi:hypothetical protein
MGSLDEHSEYAEAVMIGAEDRSIAERTMEVELMIERSMISVGRRNFPSQAFTTTGFFLLARLRTRVRP